MPSDIAILEPARRPNIYWLKAMIDSEILRDDYPTFYLKCHPLPEQESFEFTAHLRKGRSNTKELREAERLLQDKLQNTFGTDCPITIENNQRFVKRGIFGKRDMGESSKFTVKIDDIYTQLDSAPETSFKRRLIKNAQNLAMNEAVDHSFTADPSHPMYVYRWQKIVSGDLAAPGTYFDIADFKALTNAQIDRLRGNRYQRILNLFEDNPSMQEGVADTIAEMGFRKIAFLNSGSSSLAFHTVPNKEGRQQILMITPEEQERIPSPLVLPSIDNRKVVRGVDRVRIRIMPEVDTAQVTDAHIEQLRSLVIASGLNVYVDADGNPDVRKNNVGLYSYEDNGQTVTIPMILDWGAVVVPGGTNLQTLGWKWESMPELEPWRKAQHAIRQQERAENVIDHHSAARIEHRLTAGERESHVMRLLTERGFYPQEIGAASERVIEQIDRKEINPDEFIQAVEKLLTEKRNSSTLYR